MKKIAISILYILSMINITLADTFQDPYNEYISGFNLPGTTNYNFNGGNDLIIMAKEILTRALEYLPMLVLIVLLLACIKIIFDGDGKAGFKRIKYILIGVGLMILSIYVINILSSIFFGHPVLNINFHRWY